jgi:signal transduction histidine kinase
MSTTLVAPLAPLAQRLAALLSGWLGAARSLERGDWAVALAVGVALGVAETARLLAGYGDEPGSLRLDLLSWVAAIYVIEMALATTLLAVGLRALDRGGPASVARQAALVGGLSLLVATLCAGPLREATIAMRVALGVSPHAMSSSTLPVFWINVLRQGITLGLYLSLWTMVYRYLQRSRRTTQRLAAAQARGAEAERRMLAEQLAGAQAMVEPEFLFGVLQLVEQLLEHEALRSTTRTGVHALPLSEQQLDGRAPDAHRLLDELHRCLRAALPPADGGASTLGQQAELVRARLAIESIRLGGTVEVRIDVPPELAGRPLPPLLLLPLALNALHHGVEPRGGGAIALRARADGAILRVEIADDGAGRAADVRDGGGLSALRERLAALYGARATLTFADGAPRGVEARIEIDDGGGG